MKWSLTVDEVLALLGEASVEGDYEGVLSGIADLREAAPGEISFLSSMKFAQYLEGTKGSLILVPETQEGRPPSNQTWLRVADPSVALGKICHAIEGRIHPKPQPGIHPTACISDKASVAHGVSIGPFCIIDAGAVIEGDVFLEGNNRIAQDARIGEGTRLLHGASVGWGCEIGRNCHIYEGAVIGSDGFGFHSDRSGHHRLVQIGRVIIEDDVEVGANTTIDRARFAETRVGTGTRIDNLVQIGHNVKIGKHCIICAFVGISGSAELGDFVVLAGQVGVAGHLKIGDGVTATGKTGISKDVPPGIVLSGNPARPHRQEMRSMGNVQRIPAILERLKTLEANLCK